MAKPRARPPSRARPIDLPCLVPPPSLSVTLVTFKNSSSFPHNNPSGLRRTTLCFLDDSYP